ncbi:hypothetical protein TCAL_04177 [Tigriopus californicus]|uniref:Sodium/hydrogen exchanger n=1 Tax=Tigriopus californicus TaxID=6832 RepID=A0A553N7X6_TIGCA|nr:hypothetical protein TCAL_04177 [Tigriopus californicus]
MVEFGRLSWVISAWMGQAMGSAIDVAVDERKRMAHQVDSLDLLLFVCLLILTIVTLWTFKRRRMPYLHESGLAVIYGLIVGLLLSFTGSPRSESSLFIDNAHSAELFKFTEMEGPPNQLLVSVLLPNVSQPKTYTYEFKSQVDSEDANDPIKQKATFNAEIFFYVLLPPIIFHAGYNMRKKHFFDNMGAIMAFALVGTTISTFVIGLVMYGVSRLIQEIPLKFLDVLYFGAIVSATDPVTILAIFQDLHVDPMLNGLVLGESLLNDAVAIVLCSAIEEYAKVSLNGGDLFEVDALLLTLFKFFTTVFGSIGLGAFIGCLTAIVTKFTQLRDYTLLETSLFTLMSYSSYLFAEICGMSGIVAVLFCGIFQAHYTFTNLSDESKLRTRQFFETLNFLAENFIFSYLGVSMFTFSKHYFNLFFILGAFVAIAVARACNIYPLGMLMNLGRQQKIPMQYQHMMWFSGLRGAMAFALAVSNTATPVRQMFFTTTCLIAIITIPTGESSEEREELISDYEQPMASLPSHTNRSYLARRWKGLDQLYLKPLLTHGQPTLMETLPKELTFLGRWFTSDMQLQTQSREALGPRNGDEMMGTSAKDQDDPPLLGVADQD